MNFCFVVFKKIPDFPQSTNYSECLPWCVSPCLGTVGDFALYISGSLCFVALKSWCVQFHVNYQVKTKQRHKVVELESPLEIIDTLT